MFEFVLLIVIAIVYAFLLLAVLWVVFRGSVPNLDESVFFEPEEKEKGKK